jgi:hypothetical protein
VPRAQAVHYVSLRDPPLGAITLRSILLCHQVLYGVIPGSQLHGHPERPKFL